MFSAWDVIWRSCIAITLAALAADRAIEFGYKAGYAKRAEALVSELQQAYALGYQNGRLKCAQPQSFNRTSYGDRDFGKSTHFSY